MIPASPWIPARGSEVRQNRAVLQPEQPETGARGAHRAGVWGSKSQKGRSCAETEPKSCRGTRVPTTHRAQCQLSSALYCPASRSWARRPQGTPRAGQGDPSTGTLDTELQHIAKRPSGPPEHPVCLTRPTPPEGQESSSSELVNDVDHRRERGRRTGAGEAADSQSQEDTAAETRNTVLPAEAGRGDPHGTSVRLLAGHLQGSLLAHWAGCPLWSAGPGPLSPYTGDGYQDHGS